MVLVGEDDNLTALFPGKSSHPRYDQHFDITEDILLQVDSEMRQAIDLEEKVIDNLAKCISTHYKQKSRESTIRKKISNRHKLPARWM